MKCLRSGHCCIHYDVVIVDDPEKGLDDNNLIHKESGSPCKHLVGDNPGQYSCGIHSYDWYDKTPCFQYTQIEATIDSPCRLGEYFLDKKTTK